MEISKYKIFVDCFGRGTIHIIFMDFMDSTNDEMELLREINTMKIK